MIWKFGWAALSLTRTTAKGLYGAQYRRDISGFLLVRSRQGRQNPTKSLSSPLCGAENILPCVSCSPTFSLSLSLYQGVPPRGLEVGGGGIVVDAIAVEGRVVPLALRERGGP